MTDRLLKRKTDPVRIGAASATFVDSRTAMPQLLNDDKGLDFIVFDCLAEAVMGNLARSKAAGQPGYVVDWVDAQIAPYLGQLIERGIKVISNAGGLDPASAAQALRAKADEQGLSLRIAWIEGDNLSDQIEALIDGDTRDTFDGRALASELADADKALSLCVYTGAFSIAAALDAGADIVIAGRIVDSATTLGALIHSFGWGAEDFDLLASGTLAGHMIECSTQVTGGTFTDWESVDNWANIGFPIALCSADGSVILEKPEGTGGLLSCGTAAEQLLYEVSDPQHYIVPDVVCDFSGVSISEVGADRVALSGARGLGRPECLKATLTWDKGWRASALFPVIGLDAAAKARRIGAEFFARMSKMLEQRDMQPFEQTMCTVFGGEGTDASAAICRMVADHESPLAVQLFAREQSSIITSMAVGVSAPLANVVRPLSHVAGFLLPRSSVTLKLWLDGVPIGFVQPEGGDEWPCEPPSSPEEPVFDGEAIEVPLIKLAWARSGDKGNLFNVGVIARAPEFLPYVYHALKPDAVSAHYAEMLGTEAPYEVKRYSVPGFDALNLVVHDALDGGMLASAHIDPAAKGMAQLLLNFPVRIPANLQRDCV